MATLSPLPFLMNALGTLTRFLARYTFQVVKAWAVPDLVTSICNFAVLCLVIATLSYSERRLHAARLKNNLKTLSSLALIPAAWLWRYASVVLRRGLTYAFGYALLALLVARGAAAYWDGLAAAVCNIHNGTSRLVFHCPPWADAAVESPQPVFTPTRCSTYLFATGSPRLSVSLSVSSDIAFNVSQHTPAAMFGLKDPGISQLVGELNDALTEIRELLEMTNDIISLTERTLEEWAPMVKLNSLRWYFCVGVTAVYSCAEPTMAGSAHRSLVRSFEFLHKRLAVIVPFAVKQPATLLRIHGLLSEAGELARKEERAALGGGALWRGSARSRVGNAQAVQRHCDGLRCIVQVAMDAVRQLVGAINALATAAATPPAEIARIRIALGALVDRKEATFHAADALQRLMT